MKIDIDAANAMAEAQAKVIPWELTLSIGGKDHRVRPLTNSDLVRLANVGVVRDPLSAGKVLLDLFEDPKPLIESIDQAAAVITAIAMAWQEHLKKKSEALGRAIRMQIDAAEAREGRPEGSTGRT